MNYTNTELHPTWCVRCESATCHEDAGRSGLCPRCQQEDMTRLSEEQDRCEQAERERQTEQANRRTAAVAALCAAMADPMDDARRMFRDERQALRHCYGRPFNQGN